MPDDRSTTAGISPGRLRNDLADMRDRLTEWLFDKAYPLWWEVGADRQRGGYHERIGLDGVPILEPRRARVQPRQIYCFSVAHDLAWPEASSEQIHHGLDYFEQAFGTSERYIISLVDAKDQVLDSSFDLYNQAFALFGYAAAARVLNDASLIRRALRLKDYLEHEHRNPDGSFRAGPDTSTPVLANPHMHLFEAALAWEEQAGGLWTQLADEIATLALDHFVSPVTGALAEAFNDDWTPVDEGPVGIIEPGHQFEWAWLLARWGIARGRACAVDASRSLFRIAENAGVDATRNAAIASVNFDLTKRDPLARLWPQTERLKAALLLGKTAHDPDDAGKYDAAALSAAHCIETFLDLEPRGLWRDKLRADGTFVEEPAPASSFYHIVGAVVELNRLASN